MPLHCSVEKQGKAALSLGFSIESANFRAANLRSSCSMNLGGEGCNTPKLEKSKMTGVLTWATSPNLGTDDSVFRTSEVQRLRAGEGKVYTVASGQLLDAIPEMEPLTSESPSEVEESASIVTGVQVPSFGYRRQQSKSHTQRKGQSMRTTLLTLNSVSLLS